MGRSEGTDYGLYVADRHDDSVYRYDLAGNLVGAFSLVNDNGHVSGITTDGSFIWAADRGGGGRGR